MKRLYVIAVILLLFLYSKGSPCRILFIGNSYTSVNNLPQLILDIASTTGDDFYFQSSTPGGCTFQQHLTVSSALIKQGGWDFVILQEQSQLPSFPYSQFMTESYPYAQQLCNLIREYNPDAKIVFYMTWGRRDGDTQNAPYYAPLGTYEGMDSLLQARYLMMAHDNQTMIAPVAKVWRSIRENHPEIELYQSDGSHPSLTGSYAAAFTFYSLLFSKNPTIVTSGFQISDSQADIIKHTVKQIVYDSLQNWSFYPALDTNSNNILTFSGQNAPNITIFPNPAANTLYVDFSNDNPENFNLTIFDLFGRMISYNNSSTHNSSIIDTSSVPNGFYILRITNNNGFNQTLKFIKANK